MPEPACKGNLPGGTEFRDVKVEAFRGYWRNWCDNCEERAQELGFDDPAEISEIVLRRTGGGSGRNGPKDLHLPLEALEGVPASA